MYYRGDTYVWRVSTPMFSQAPDGVECMVPPKLFRRFAQGHKPVLVLGKHQGGERDP